MRLFNTVTKKTAVALLTVCLAVAAVPYAGIAEEMNQSEELIALGADAAVEESSEHAEAGESDTGSSDESESDGQALDGSDGPEALPQGPAQESEAATPDGGVSTLASKSYTITNFSDLKAAVADTDSSTAQGDTITFVIKNDIVFTEVIALPWNRSSVFVAEGGSWNLTWAGPAADSGWEGSARHFLSYGTADHAQTITFNAGLTIDGAGRGGGLSIGTGGSAPNYVNDNYNCTIVLNGATFTNCVTAQSGGAISIDDYTPSNKLELKSGAISNSRATGDGSGGYFRGGHGGGVFFGGDTITLSGARIENCRTDTLDGRSGGGIYVDANARFAFTAGTITGCTAAVGGGLGLNGGSALDFTGGSITDSVAYNEQQNQGENGFGGGIGAYGATMSVSGTATVSGNTGRHGGGIFGGGGTAITLGGGALVDSNQAASITDWGSRGGGVYVDDGSSLKIEGAMISNNRATSATSARLNGHGGGVASGDYGAPSSIEFTSGSIKTNSSDIGGGGVYLMASNTFTMTGGIIDGCYTKDSGGGILATESAVIKLFGGSIENCSARGLGWYGGWGGGINLAGTVDLQIDGTDITNCSATDPGASVGDDRAVGSGGGIYVNQDTGAGVRISIADSTMSGNTASANGGAIFTAFLSNLTVDASTVSFTGNTAGAYRVPADDVAADPSVYPCSRALSSSDAPSGTVPAGRSHPLNNYDISYFSYTVAYHGNGGESSASNEVAYFVQEVPFRSLGGVTATVKRQNAVAFDGATIDYALDRYAFAGWAGAEVPRVDGSDIKVADETWSVGGDVLTTAFPLVEFYAAYKTDIVIRNVAAGDTEFFDYTRAFGLWFAVWDPATGYSGDNSFSDWYYTPSNGEADNKITYYYKTVFGANEAPGLDSIRVSYDLNGTPIGRAHSGAPGSDGGIWDVDLTDDLVDGQGSARNVLTVTNTYDAPPITDVESEEQPYWLLIVGGAALVLTLLLSARRRSRKIDQSE